MSNRPPGTPPDNRYGVPPMPGNPYNQGPRVTYAGAGPQNQSAMHYERELGQLRAQLAEYEDTFRKINAEPHPCATVVEIRPEAGKMFISTGPGNVVDVGRLEGAKVGDRILINRNTLQGMEVVPDDNTAPAGTIVTIERVSDDGRYVEATLLTMLKTLKRPPEMKLAKGERVVLDPSTTYIIGSLGKPPQAFSFAPKVSVSWDDIGGHADAKAQLREAIELPLAHPALFKAYGKRAVRGVLLHGAAGCGKTILAKAAATSIARAHGHKASAGFVYIKGPELLNPYIGRSEEAIRALFSAARAHKAEHGYPSVIFLDECDALLGARERGVNVSVNATTVPQFLSEMDGMDETAAIFILATNRPEALDSAVMREGRVDRKIRIDRPSADDALGIFEIHLKGRPLAYAPEQYKTNASHASIGRDYLYSDDRVLAERRNDENVIEKLRLRDLASGAKIAEIVERASSRAIMRDIESAGKLASGIMPEDLTWAIDRDMEGLRDLAKGDG